MGSEERAGSDLTGGGFRNPATDGQRSPTASEPTLVSEGDRRRSCTFPARHVMCGPDHRYRPVRASAPVQTYRWLRRTKAHDAQGAGSDQLCLSHLQTPPSSPKTRDNFRMIVLLFTRIEEGCLAGIYGLDGYRRSMSGCSAVSPSPRPVWRDVGSAHGPPHRPPFIVRGPSMGSSAKNA